MVRIIIVNGNDEIIGHKKRGTLKQSDIYRVSALWIRNSNGDILLAQRKFTKKNDPGKWGPAVAGTNDEGESYESNIIKEAEEEIGLKNCNFQKIDNIRYIGEYNYFCQWFLLTVDKELDEFIIQESEVEQIKWFKKDELLGEFKKNPDKFLEVIQDCINF
ncbi:MAG: NUDIX domain-containing protein [Candidatus Gracilibacteria bacterium]|nr:NUDIX domain-containing protein [Candidatus Gracilibacteria bacterium]